MRDATGAYYCRACWDANLEKRRKPPGAEVPIVDGKVDVVALGGPPAPSPYEPCPGCERPLHVDVAICMECGFDRGHADRGAQPTQVMERFDEARRRCLTALRWLVVRVVALAVWALVTLAVYSLIGGVDLPWKRWTILVVASVPIALVVGNVILHSDIDLGAWDDALWSSRFSVDHDGASGVHEFVNKMVVFVVTCGILLFGEYFLFFGSPFKSP